MKNTTKIIAAALLVLSLTGCGELDRNVSALTGGATKTCVDGVTYLQFTSGASVQYDQNGAVVKCQK